MCRTQPAKTLLLFFINLLVPQAPRLGALHEGSAYKRHMVHGNVAKHHGRASIVHVKHCEWMIMAVKAGQSFYFRAVSRKKRLLKSSGADMLRIHCVMTCSAGNLNSSLDQLIFDGQRIKKNL